MPQTSLNRRDWPAADIGRSRPGRLLARPSGWYIKREGAFKLNADASVSGKAALW